LNHLAKLVAPFARKPPVDRDVRDSANLFVSLTPRLAEHSAREQVDVVPLGKRLELINGRLSFVAPADINLPPGRYEIVQVFADCWFVSGLIEKGSYVLKPAIAGRGDPFAVIHTIKIGEFQID
jgi:hypothetical protein